ncbi:poly-gamma-glutamate hydrolase family protein [Bacillus sp. YC2]|uniref:poly-gamma-glutamate hydrolase family protein n=1 Tax=Bacillus sp. YC2 TaxID=2861287 RepID=UPI001CA70CD6|nr:poly-gamma-glutamate hydrolase family protein [Bacillus sp. YC2]MBY8913793.1 poly-gamma-glutamate hydrolase family protein [Bacillus sp. YC2]
MNDMYHHFHALQAAESEYRIVCREKQEADRIVFSPHGGGIEPGVSELVHAFSDRCSIYLFEGMKKRNNHFLHLTSTRFDEPIALRMVKQHDAALAFHGYRDITKRHTIAGGSNIAGAKAIVESLREAGFSAELAAESGRFKGAHPANIVNQSKKALGIQLELSTAQRRAFFDHFTFGGRRFSKNGCFFRYVEAVKRVFYCED